MLTYSAKTPILRNNFIIRERGDRYRNPGQIHHPHDKGYKYLLSHKDNFLELLRSFVNEDWVQRVDAAQMERMDKTFISDDFLSIESDVIYRMSLGNMQVIFYVLMELQSTVDFQMPYRLLRYMMEIWKDHIKQAGSNAKTKGFQLPVIVPIVLYNGKEPWTARRSFKETMAGYELFGQGLLDFEYILLDVSRYDSQELLDKSELMASALLMDQCGDYSEIMERLRRLQNIFREWDITRFNMFKIWIKEIIGRDSAGKEIKEIQQILEHANPEEADKMIYNLEIAIKEEMEKAKMEGKMDLIRSILLKGYSVNQVAEMTELTVDEVQKAAGHIKEHYMQEVD